MRITIFLFVICLCLLSCKKDDGTAGNKVELYLLESYETVAGKCEINASRSVLQSTAIVKNDDVIAYSRTNYQFKLSSAAIQKIKAFNDRTPFAVSVDKQVIYFGILKPFTSSSSCDNSITMDIDVMTNDKISLRLGYPGLYRVW